MGDFWLPWVQAIIDTLAAGMPGAEFGAGRKPPGR
jgi:hypothetical protein